MSLLCIYGNTGVVAHSLVCSGDEIEERSLSAVRVSHERHVYSPAFLQGSIMQIVVREHLLLVIVACIYGFLLQRVCVFLCLLGFFFRHYLNH